MQPIGYIHTQFPTKFGVPRQSGLCATLSRIRLLREYSDPECVRGLTEFSHIWLIWGFSQVPEEKWSPTVRPPRLGGNKRMGVFATRSPFRPNHMGLSCVKLISVSREDNCTVITVEGADMMDNTPIFDIKPYLPYTDSYPEAIGGFGSEKLSYALEVDIPNELAALLPSDVIDTLRELLSQDPRPSYQNQPERIYGFPFADFEIKFTVSENKLTVCSVTPL